MKRVVLAAVALAALTAPALAAPPAFSTFETRAYVCEDPVNHQRIKFTVYPKDGTVTWTRGGEDHSARVAGAATGSPQVRNEFGNYVAVPTLYSVRWDGGELSYSNGPTGVELAFVSPRSVSYCLDDFGAD
jgi:hypothetical protein